jgi:hypothetical protein
MFSALFRVLFGFVLACLAAGVTIVMFAVGTDDVASGDPDRLSKILELVALTATHSAVFAAPFALLTAVISEWQSFRSVFFHALAGLGIATSGFTVQFFSETPGSATVANQYPILAYAVTGIMAGLVYWLFAGRRAGYSHDDIFEPVPVTHPSGSVPSTRPRTPPAPPPPKRD